MARIGSPLSVATDYSPGYIDSVYRASPLSEHKRVAVLVPTSNIRLLDTREHELIIEIDSLGEERVRLNVSSSPLEGISVSLEPSELTAPGQARLRIKAERPGTYWLRINAFTGDGVLRDTVVVRVDLDPAVLAPQRALGVLKPGGRVVIPVLVNATARGWEIDARITGEPLNSTKPIRGGVMLVTPGGNLTVRLINLEEGLFTDPKQVARTISSKGWFRGLLLIEAPEGLEPGVYEVVFEISWVKERFLFVGRLETRELRVKVVSEG
jgi:hypothetical protein